MAAFTAADIQVTLVDRDGVAVTLPAFSRPSDRDWQRDPEMAAEQNARADEREINWIEDHQIASRWTCSADGTRVAIHVVGTLETATCSNGHRWLRTFGEQDGWRQVP